MHTTNLEKHTTNNPISKFFLNNFLNTVISVVKPLRPKNILDVGCGEGFTLDRLDKEGIGEKLEGVDYVDEAIRIGKEMHPKLVLKRGDIYDLQYKGNSFELVLCTEVLEHLENPRKGLKELLRVSKKHVLVTVPNEPWFTLQRIVRFKNVSQLGAHPEHIQHWTSGSFEQFVLNSARSHLGEDSQGRTLTIRAKKIPFPWTMLLLEKQ